MSDLFKEIPVIDKPVRDPKLLSETSKSRTTKFKYTSMKDLMRDYQIPMKHNTDPFCKPDSEKP